MLASGEDRGWTGSVSLKTCACIQQTLAERRYVPGTQVGTGDMVVSSEPGALAVPEGRLAGDHWTAGAQHHPAVTGVGEMISGGEGKGLAGWRGPGRPCVPGLGEHLGVRGSALHAHF